MTASPATLVPPVRLGRLLHDARVAHAESVPDLVQRCGYAYDPDFFDGVEAGRVPLDDTLVRWLAALYDVRVDQLVPARSQLVIDVDEGWVSIGERRQLLAPSAPEEVLTKYLALVYELRGLPVGSSLRLRDLDLDVLGEALTLRTRDVQRRLHDLMQGDREPVDSVARRVRKGLVVPLAGVLVAVTGVGALLFVRDGGDASPPPATTQQVDISRAGAVAPGTVEVGSAAVEVNPNDAAGVRIDVPIVVERGPDGSEITRIRQG